MDERRRTERQGVAEFDVRRRVLLSEGRTVLGKVIDVSEGGARIRGQTDGIAVDDQLQVVFLYRTGEQVSHRCPICHLAPGDNEFGVRFDSDPFPIVVHFQK